MENTRIDTGETQIMVNDDPNRVITFNPTDIMFAEKFYELLSELQTSLREFKQKSDKLEENTQTDENGVSVNWREQIALQREFCEMYRGRIDSVFGEGTSQAAFGNTRNLDMFKQFFNGILPFFQQTRADKIAQYTTPASAKRNKRK